MRSVEPSDLAGNCACAMVARSSAVAPEFLLADNERGGLFP